jgi:hypothetical protein
VYAYQFARAPAYDQLGAIRAVLDTEHTAARHDARTWTARTVSEERLTHILLASDSPDHARDANHRLENRLRLLSATFSLTVPMPLDDDESSLPERGTAAGGGSSDSS